ncbi:hypothetical protein GCM10027614_16240 [Micromonospora vulcania]
MLRDSGQRGDVNALADLLGDLARTIVERYRGDLRRLRAVAHRDPARERALLDDLPGVDDQVVDLFLRETQALWREVAPVADRRALTAPAGSGWVARRTIWPAWPTSPSSWPGWWGPWRGSTWSTGTPS